MMEQVEKIDSSRKLDFRPQNQFALEFYKPADDGYSVTSKAQNDEINKYIKETSEKRAARAAKKEQLAKGALSTDPTVISLAQDIRTNGKTPSPAPSGEDDGPILDVAAQAKKQGRKDHISALFQVPKMRPDSTNFRDTYVDFTTDVQKGVDKEHFFKKNFYSEYTEMLAKYKDTMR